MRAMCFLQQDGVDGATAAELVGAGRWEPLANGYRILPELKRHQSLARDV
jgi:hypothetical protein